MAGSRLNLIEERILDLELHLIAVGNELKQAERLRDSTRRSQNLQAFRPVSELKLQRATLKQQLYYLNSEKKKLEAAQKKAAQTVPKNKVVKDEYRKRHTADPNKSTDEILKEIAADSNESYASIKRLYYYESKKT